eukprot:m.127318 g.127318  ORF g.127318 m.127318 type:complete len:336 (+) comp29265_c0_seq1:281-1288(+)
MISVDNLVAREKAPSIAGVFHAAMSTQNHLNAAMTGTMNDDDYKPALFRTAVAVLAAHLFLLAMVRGMLPFMGGNGGADVASEWYTCYLIEESLSMDNLFAFYLVFRYFHVPIDSQNRVLKWGIVGAVVMRAMMIGAGAVMVTKFHFLLLFFAGILIYQGGKILNEPTDENEDEEDLSSNWIVVFARKLVPVSKDFHGSDFFVVEGGSWKATPLLLVLVIIELSDVVFAIDSVPAAFGVSSNSVVIFTANMFAILSLRSLYSIIAHAVNDLPYLQKSIGAVLLFVGLKMFAEPLGITVTNRQSLFIVLLMLLIGVLASLIHRRRMQRKPKSAMVV